MKAEVERFFERYERFFARSLAGDVDANEMASLYAPEFIAATPSGVMTGRNNETLRQAMAEGYARYRAIGTKEMRVRHVRISPIDAHHCIAHIAWTATYARGDRPDLPIDFDVHYLMQFLDGAPRIFGWIAGDEQELLREHGIV